MENRRRGSPPDSGRPMTTPLKNALSSPLPRRLKCRGKEEVAGNRDGSARPSQPPGEGGGFSAPFASAFRPGAVGWRAPRRFAYKLTAALKRSGFYDADPCPLPHPGKGKKRHGIPVPPSVLPPSGASRRRKNPGTRSAGSPIITASGAGGERSQDLSPDFATSATR